MVHIICIIRFRASIKVVARVDIDWYRGIVHGGAVGRRRRGSSLIAVETAAVATATTTYHDH